MLKKLPVALLILLFAVTANAQVSRFIIPKYVRLPADSVQSRQLLAALDDFLSQVPAANNRNTRVLKEDLPETAALLDEIKNMADGTGADKKDFYKCYLTNVAAVDSSAFVVQFAYMGVDAPTPLLRASFRLIAKNRGGRFYLCSPFKMNTIGWQIKKNGSFRFHYNAPVELSKANYYLKKAMEFDIKLNAPVYNTQIYFCGNLPNALQLLGVDYKSDYNGLNQGNLSSFEENTSFQLIGGDPVDPAVLDLHDLWHDRLHRVISTSIINKPVDEACAYLYGGSWGISWRDIFKRFTTYMGANKNWLAAFSENKNFGDSQRYHLYVSYVINALIVQQMEKDKGFEAVKELLGCGRREAGNENYFRALEKISGINRANFNTRIGKMVADEAAKY